MPTLSPDCIERLRALDGRLGSIALRIDAHAAPGATHPLAIGDAARLELTHALSAPEAMPLVDDDCRAIFRGIEPKIGRIVAGIAGAHPVNQIRAHLDDARDYLGPSIGF